MKSGSLNLLEPSGPHRACTGLLIIIIIGGILRYVHKNVTIIVLYYVYNVFHDLILLVCIQGVTEGTDQISGGSYLC